MLAVTFSGRSQPTATTATCLFLLFSLRFAALTLGGFGDFLARSRSATGRCGRLWCCLGRRLFLGLATGRHETLLSDRKHISIVQFDCIVMRQKRPPSIKRGASDVGKGPIPEADTGKGLGEGGLLRNPPQAARCAGRHELRAFGDVEDAHARLTPPRRRLPFRRSPVWFPPTAAHAPDDDLTRFDRRFARASRSALRAFRCRLALAPAPPS